MVEVRDHGDVPGATGQRARFESAGISGDVADDHFDNFVWQAAGGFVRAIRFGGCITIVWAEEVTKVIAI
jgi:hypothetical protein